MVAYLIMRNKTWNRMVTSLIGAGKECNKQSWRENNVIVSL